MSFKRNISPKEAMSIGGIDLKKHYDPVISSFKDFSDFMETLIGKDISFTVDRMYYSIVPQRQNLPDIKHMKLKRWGYEIRNAGPFDIILYLIEEDDNYNQRWYVDTSKKIYLR